MAFDILVNNTAKNQVDCFEFVVGQIGQSFSAQLQGAFNFVGQPIPQARIFGVQKIPVKTRVVRNQGQLADKLLKGAKNLLRL